MLPGDISRRRPRIRAQPLPKEAEGHGFGRAGGDHVHVQPELLAFVFQRPDAHGPRLREEVAHGLPLEPEGGQRLLDRLQLAVGIKHHQIDNPFARTAGDGGAPNMLDRDHGQHGGEGRRDPLRDLCRPRVILNACRRLQPVSAD